ncbi:MAG: hypothetical protein ACXWP0_10135 [Ktedonobacterales bacterium]
MAVEAGSRGQCGPQPVLANSEVLTMEVVGEYLGLEWPGVIAASASSRTIRVFSF